MAPLYNPSLDEFLRCARQEFHFLVADFGFREEPRPRHGEINEYQIRYDSRTTVVIVDGINWGYGVDVRLEPKRQPMFRSRISLPLWAIVKLRKPDLNDGLAIGDQLAQLRTHAVALRECAKGVLEGDFAVRGEINKLMEEVASRERSAEVERRLRGAMEAANEAFRSKDYRRVVDILVQHEHGLSPAQRSKLAYAKQKIEVDTSRKPET